MCYTMTIIHIKSISDIPKKIKHRGEVYKIFTSGMNKAKIKSLYKSKEKNGDHGTVYMVLKTYESNKLIIYVIYYRIHYPYLVK